MFCSVIH